MKKIFLLAALIVTSVATTLADTPEDAIKVGTAEELINAINDHPKSYIKLTANIDMTAQATITKTFSGTIDGETFGEEGKGYFRIFKERNKISHYDPLFKNLQKATLKNLVITGMRVQSESEDNRAALCSTMDSCTLENINVADVSVFADDNKAGTLAGTATNCSFTNVVCLNSDVTVDGMYAGGLVGMSSGCTYIKCMTNEQVSVFADGNLFDSNAYSGGLVGCSTSDNFDTCYNFALVGSNDDRTGGIAAFGVNSHFDHCLNAGMVVHCTEEVFRSNKQAIMDNVAQMIRECRITWVTGFFLAMVVDFTEIAIPFWATMTFPPVAVAVAVATLVLGATLTAVG